MTESRKCCGAGQTRRPVLPSSRFQEDLGLAPPTRVGGRGQRAARVGSDGWKTMRPSLEDTVFFVVGLKVFIHATGVGHLFAINLWQELRVLDALLLVEQDVGRVSVDLLRVHFLVRENGSVVVPRLS